MKIAILSRNRSLYSTRRLAQSARSHGHLVRIIDTLSIPVRIGQGPTGKPVPSLPQADAIIPRIGTSITFYGLAVVRQFEATGLITTATAAGIARSRDKLHSMQIMNGAGLPIPNTTIVNEPEDIGPAIQIAGGLPVVIKLIRGTQGRGVFLATEMHIVESLFHTVRRRKEQLLIQEYIRESRGQDIRIIVVGNRCVAAMRRIAAEGEFRSNLHRGGRALPFEVDQGTRQLASRAAQAHELGVAGVDLVRSNRGPLLLEVNSSPGLEGIEKTTKIDVAVEIVRYLERESKKKRQKLRQQRKRKR